MYYVCMYVCIMYPACGLLSAISVLELEPVSGGL